ncbi:hypothetical protein Psfp_04280 [Pelotomaculum sp. FP]|uniref:hypothetical protein n=1 Tax=Pelotomaculum sp. FP TaxID=261474 RepID=UPI00106643DC|nr:hypothetical protein [Pelotomaculum sp. FP]TEB09333.1 hypothetical protein Psfp_04280 [Pelotomaculum sp. FP]
MKTGEYVNTPRFLKVYIEEVFETIKELYAAGYYEPTHYEGDYAIQGKHIGINRMTFAAAKK